MNLCEGGLWVGRGCPLGGVYSSRSGPPQPACDKIGYVNSRRVQLRDIAGLSAPCVVTLSFSPVDNLLVVVGGSLSRRYAQVVTPLGLGHRAR